MARDTGLGRCPSCGSRSISAIGRAPTMRQFIRTGVARSLAAQDLVCGNCGHSWPLSEAEQANPWTSEPTAPKPGITEGDIDEDELDRRWEQWSQRDAD